jgi:tetratricopeptide (TPR) repeat protein
VTLKIRLSVAYATISLAFAFALVVTLDRVAAGADAETTFVAFLAVVAAWVVALARAKSALVRAANRRLSAAVHRGDTAAARVELSQIVSSAAETPANRAAARIAEAKLHGLAGRHEHAARLLEAIDPAPLASLQRALLFDNLAYARALSGRAEDAVRAAEKARALCPAHADARTRGRILGTLGIARVRSGQHDEGVALLAEVLGAGGIARDEAVRAYFLGEGLRAMGRTMEAREAYARGARAAPASEWGKRAAERLAVPQAPFR